MDNVLVRTIIVKRIGMICLDINYKNIINLLNVDLCS
jgi:hypothetical protein